MNSTELKKEDFNLSVNSRGYMISYKGKNIGGVGTIESNYKKVHTHYKVKQANIKMYSEMAKKDINDLVTGRGSQYMREVIERINKEEK